MSFERTNDSRIQILHPTQGSYKDKRCIAVIINYDNSLG